VVGDLLVHDPEDGLHSLHDPEEAEELEYPQQFGITEKAKQTNDFTFINLAQSRVARIITYIESHQCCKNQ
jgi:hypothetical protein